MSNSMFDVPYWCSVSQKTQIEAARLVMILAIGITVSSCGMGSVHPGEKSHLDGSSKMGCDTEEAFNKLDTYVNKNNDVDRANRELIFTQLCKRFKSDEVVN